jgi:hypothetical protein
MIDIILPLDSNLICGKCYTFSAEVTDFTTNITIEFGTYYPDDGFGGSYFISNGQVGTITGNGTVTLDFDSEECTTGITIPPSNAIKIVGGEATITNTTLFLDENCEAYLCSECYTVAKDCEQLMLIEYWNDEDSFNLNYQNANFKQRLLIPAVLQISEYPYPIEEIHKYADGRKAPIKTDTESVYDLKTKSLPDYLINALRVALKHKHLYINGESYSKVEGSVTPEFDVVDSLAAQVVVQVQKNNQDLYADIC